MSNFILSVLDDAAMAAVDTTANTLIEGVSGGDLIRVPVSLQIYKPAGVAYTIGAGCRLLVKDEDGVVLFSVAAEGFLDQTTAQRRFVLPNSVAFAGVNYGFYLSASAAITAAAGTQPSVYFRLEFRDVAALQVW